jgi:ABC-2 type transport system ATP-binding protein
LIDELSASGTTVLVTTHYLDEAERCDRVAIMHSGKLAALGTIQELKRTFADRPIVEIHSADPVATMA